MPNIGALLKQEIVRLSRREIRAQLLATKKASAQSRAYVAALKRQVATLERQVALLHRRALDQPPAAPIGAATMKSVLCRQGSEAATETPWPFGRRVREVSWGEREFGLQLKAGKRHSAPGASPENCDTS